jgi:polysaccharide export outer membrane protein
MSLQIFFQRTAAVSFLFAVMAGSLAYAQNTMPQAPSSTGSGIGNPTLETNPQQSEVFQQQQDGRHYSSQSTDPSYVLQGKDSVQIVIFQEDELNTITRVSPEGMITFPLIGQVHVGGLTVAEASSKIRAMLMDGYIRNPQVSMTVTEFALRRFSVLGEVQRPGTYEMPQQESVNLLQALALAGGYTKLADPGKITVKRVDGGKETVYRLNAKAMARDPATRQFYVQPDDTITVAQSLF